MSRILLHAWSIQKKDNEYFLAYTHWTYLQQIIKYYDEIVLLSPCKLLKNGEDTSYVSLRCLDSKITVYELPDTGKYIKSIKYFFKYLNAYFRLKDINTYYTRYPVPFGWLQKVFSGRAKRIIHYVGDPIDAAANNPNFSPLKKSILINLFKLENAMYNWACHGAKIYTNGNHIAERLSKKGIYASPLISSTLGENDFYFDKRIDLDPNKIRFIYLGNLRTAKGVETILRAFHKYQGKYSDSSFTLIGSGEFEDELRKIIANENIQNVTFTGRIDDRSKINLLLRSHDIFIFASLSEGSPRVILEAMANGLPVISTPVGSLPGIFKDGEEIVYADFNNSISFFNEMEKLASDIDQFETIRTKSHVLVKKFTIESFIKKIFNEK